MHGVSTSSSYAVRSNGFEGYVEYDQVESCAMKYVAEVQRDVRKLGAHAHVFCSVAELIFCYKDHVSISRKTSRKLGRILRSSVR